MNDQEERELDQLYVKMGVAYMREREAMNKQPDKEATPQPDPGYGWRLIDPAKDAPYPGDEFLTDILQPGRWFGRTVAHHFLPGVTYRRRIDPGPDWELVSEEEARAHVEDFEFFNNEAWMDGRWTPDWLPGHWHCGRIQAFRRRVAEPQVQLDNRWHEARAQAFRRRVRERVKDAAELFEPRHEWVPRVWRLPTREDANSEGIVTLGVWIDGRWWRRNCVWQGCGDLHPKSWTHWSTPLDPPAREEGA